MNDSQKAAVSSTGPTLLIAGPGTGKTYTIIQRVLYLIREKRVKPEEIMLVTYTQKASKELTTRLTDVLSKAGIEVNLHEMYIGTFHHRSIPIFRRIICRWTSSSSSTWCMSIFRNLRRSRIFAV